MSSGDDRRRRFERLERARPDLPHGDERAGAAGRFQGLETGAAAPAAPRVPGSAGDRFRPPPERAPELAPRADGEQPFLRCMRCETDNGREAQSCAGCGEDLRTDAQQAFNQRLWEARRDEAAALERDNLSRREARREAEEAAALARRQAAEQLAREVGRRERERLDREEGGLLSRWRELLRVLLGP